MTTSVENAGMGTGHPHEISISFEYSKDEPFRNLATAVQAFSETVDVYAKNKKSSLRINEFEPGSLICHLAANEPAWSGVQVLTQDLRELQNGRVNPFMTDSARRLVRKLLQNVQSIWIRLGAVADHIHISRRVLDSLESIPKQDFTRPVIRSGVLDKIDLRSNSFRITLPHGQSINCTPAIQNVALLSDSLHHELPRLRIEGEGKYKGSSDILPSTISVKSVRVIEGRKSFQDLVSSITENIDCKAVSEAIQQHNDFIESRYGMFEGSADE